MMQPFKTHRLLQCILGAFLLIALRVWHLAVVQREERLSAAERPRQREILLRADRGTICDRFHIPLAVNKICYNAALYYEQIAQIPSYRWEEKEGKKIRVAARKEYIRALSEALAKTLQLDAERVEDLIHAKASLFPHAPFILKADLSEKEHYRLKALEKEWLGVHAEIASTRSYPLGQTASHLIGTMGAISSEEYVTLAAEMRELKKAVALYEQGEEMTLPKGFVSFEEVYQRLAELKERAYSLNDLVGKSGIEAQFEGELRGFFGKRTFEIDRKGRFVREVAGGRAAIPGREIVLSISAELQQFAEKLLSESEVLRDGCSRGIDPLDKKRKVQKQPWIKGGAILALDPNTGEVLAMASSPRFDPNDFIPSKEGALHRKRQRQVFRWLENEHFIARVWDGRDLLYRERGQELLSWDLYLNLILEKEGPLREFFQRVNTVKEAIEIQEEFERLLYFSPKKPLELLESLFTGKVQTSRLIAHLLPIPTNEDRLFAIDLCRLAVDASRFTDPLLQKIGSLKLGLFRSLGQALQRLEEELRLSLQESYHEQVFKEWREQHQKEFLAQKRREEKGCAHPYLDYLDQKEKELFTASFRKERLALLTELILGQRTLSLPPLLQRDLKILQGTCKQLLGAELLPDFLHTLRSYEQLERPLYGCYRSLRNRGGEQTEKDLAAAFMPLEGFGFARSYAFQSAAPLGSLFKLVTGYEGLRQGAMLTLIDELSYNPNAAEGKRQILARSLRGTLYPRIYKGGRLPRSSKANIGEVDLIGALEQSSNPFFSILAGDFLADPDDLAKAARQFGFGEKSGIDLPGELRGKVPSDLKKNRTGLYSFAIGQHTLLTTPLQAALMLATLGNGGDLLKPKLVRASLGLCPKRDPLEVFASRNGLAQRELNALGIHFPLFTASLQPNAAQASEVSTQLRRHLDLPVPIRLQLLKGMDRSVWGEKGSARPTAIRALVGQSALLKSYLALQHQMVGKTSTAEVLFNANRNPSSLPQIYKHVWFGALSFEEGNWDRPELVVVVFLRYADAGKEAAPIAAQIIHKWRAIKKRHSSAELVQNRQSSL